MEYLNMNLLRLKARVFEWDREKKFCVALRTNALMFEIKAWAKRLKRTNTSAPVSAFLKAPEAKELSPRVFWDLHFLRQLDNSGFIDRLYSHL
jgi:hypothetical protein